VSDVQYWISQASGQRTRILRVKVPHRVDAQPAHQRHPALHARYLEQSALVDELEESLDADAGLPGEPLAVDLQRRAMQQLVRVTDADSTETAHIGV